jgi:orotidine-5'-phosphate decarboxylase
LAFDFSKTLSPRERLIFPLDLPDRTLALKYLKLLKNAVGFFKVGLELFTAEGPDFVKAMRDTAPDAGLFLDLKFHDIPRTVGRAVKSVMRLAPDLLTVHAQGGKAMLKEALDNAGGARVLAVTLLTSINPNDIVGIKDELKTEGKYPLLLAKSAYDSGVRGIVCSPRELSAMRESLGKDCLLVTPGIRPRWAEVESDDQERTGSPQEAIRKGANLLVVGRPIRDHRDPLEAARLTEEEISLAVS